MSDPTINFGIQSVKSIRTTDIHQIVATNNAEFIQKVYCVPLKNGLEISPPKIMRIIKGSRALSPSLQSNKKVVIEQNSTKLVLAQSYYQYLQEKNLRESELFKINSNHTTLTSNSPKKAEKLPNKSKCSCLF